MQLCRLTVIALCHLGELLRLTGYVAGDRLLCNHEMRNLLHHRANLLGLVARKQARLGDFAIPWEFDSTRAVGSSDGSLVFDSTAHRYL